MEAAGEDLEIKFSLFAQTQGREIQCARYISAQNTNIMKDESTADMKISCGEKENKKIFNVHKSFFCVSSPVFRAAIESDMVEGRTKEIYIEEVDEKTLQEMINYIYTGDFTGADLNVQMVAWLADKYDIPGMMDLLYYKMKIKENVGAEDIADMLIAAGKHTNISLLCRTNILFSTTGIHDSAALKKIAMDKLGKNKKILSDPACRRKFKGEQVHDVLLDIIEELL